MNTRDDQLIHARPVNLIFFQANYETLGFGLRIIKAATFLARVSNTKDKSRII